MLQLCAAYIRLHTFAQHQGPAADLQLLVTTAHCTAAAVAHTLHRSLACTRHSSSSREIQQRTCSVLSGQHGVLAGADAACCALDADQVSNALLLLDQLILRCLDLHAQPVVNDEVVTHLIVAITLGPAGGTANRKNSGVRSDTKAIENTHGGGLHV